MPQILNMCSAKTGWVIGVNHGIHDSSAAIFKDGELVFWVEQERISRIKHAVGISPAQSIKACLDFTNTNLNEIDCIALGSDHNKLGEWLGLSESERKKQLPFDSLNWLLPISTFGPYGNIEVRSYAHHDCHAASAYFGSGFESANCLIMDAMGENTSTSAYYFTGLDRKKVFNYGVSDSIGFFYEAAAEYCGFSKTDAGKFMGLAAYGEPIFLKNIPLSISEDNRKLWQHRKYSESSGREGIEARHQSLIEYFKSNCFPFHAGLIEDLMSYKNFASSVQHAVELCVFDLVDNLINKTGEKNLVLAGGVALNCTMNGKLSQHRKIDKFYVQPASTDSGVAYGAGVLACIDLYGSNVQLKSLTHPYWGESEGPDEIEIALELSGLKYEEKKFEDICSITADALNNHKIVAWHQGRAEVGPRALGARSLLGNPTNRANLIKLNKIKNREIWRPLAPSVLEQYYDSYFMGRPNNFMLVSAVVKESKRSQVPAIVHVDGTARPQSINKLYNNRYHKLVEKFHNLSGIPLLINTSLNGRGMPVCYKVRDSINFFKKSQIDLLVVENFLVEK